MKEINTSLITLSLLLNTGILFSQNYDYVWLLGRNSQTNPYYAGSVIDFNTDPPDIYSEFREMNFTITNTSMCDSLGNLLFYTNGLAVYNAENGIMENGDGLNPGEAAEIVGDDGYRLDQGVLCIPVPESDHLYYLFHLDRRLTTEQMQAHSKVLYYTLIDMNLNNGLGAVIEKNQVILEDFLELGKLTAVKHANGLDWWMLIRKFASNEYYRIYVSSDTVAIDGIASTEFSIPSPGVGQAVFSPDGSKFANLHLVGFLGDPTRVNIYDFDRCTGELSNQISISFIDSAWVGGVAISPNSRYLYVSSFINLYQYDLWADNIEASKDTVAVWDGFVVPPVFATTFFLAQLGPNGKIYINSNNGVNFLHVINHPDLPGYSCEVCQHCIELPSTNKFSLPNFPNYRLGAAAEPCDSIIDVVEKIVSEVHIDVFPNPAREDFTFQLSTPPTQKLILSLYNAQGQLMEITQLSVGQSLKKVEVQDWPSGIYFYLLSDENGEVFWWRKVVISP